MLKIGKGRACVYFNVPFETKLAIGLNSSLRDPSPLGRILLLVSLLNSFHQEGPLYFENDILMFQQHQAGGKLRDKNSEESWALLEDLAFYDNESWNDPRDFAKPVKVISMPHDVPSTSDRRMLELEDQIKNLMRKPKASSTQPPPCQANVVNSTPFQPS
ncbi:hypothetical protein Tco_0948556 [Tanacetum coccineum]